VSPAPPAQKMPLPLPMSPNQTQAPPPPLPLIGAGPAAAGPLIYHHPTTIQYGQMNFPVAMNPPTRYPPPTIVQPSREEFNKFVVFGT
jgi:hypothetical protein